MGARRRLLKQYTETITRCVRRGYDGYVRFNSIQTNLKIVKTVQKKKTVWYTSTFSDKVVRKKKQSYRFMWLGTAQG